MQATQETPSEKRKRGERNISPRGRVRMTMEIDVPLHRRLKMEAAERGMTMREYVSELLEQSSPEAVE